MHLQLTPINYAEKFSPWGARAPPDYAYVDAAAASSKTAATALLRKQAAYVSARLWDISSGMTQQTSWKWHFTGFFGVAAIFSGVASIVIGQLDGACSVG